MMLREGLHLVSERNPNVQLISQYLVERPGW